jgi:site-specific DNA-methyltransferase (adenine-specific)
VRINTFVAGDCLELLPHLDDQSIDVVLTDCPYGLTQNPWDIPFDLEAWWREIKRVTRDGIIMTAANPFAAQVIAANLSGFRYDLVWEKNRASSFLNAKRRPMRAHELILVFGAPRYFPQMTHGHKPMNSYTKHRPDGSNYGATRRGIKGGGRTERYPRSVLRIPVVPNDHSRDQNGEPRLHPTQKPLALFDYLVRTFSASGDLILDPFSGAGTTAVAAIMNQRRFLCFEKDPELARKAQARLAKLPGGLAC